eukprot:1289620-Amorphochlora_amoeboformis.AAC.1
MHPFYAICRFFFLLAFPSRPSTYRYSWFLNPPGPRYSVDSNLGSNVDLLEKRCLRGLEGPSTSTKDLLSQVSCYISIHYGSDGIRSGGSLRPALDHSREAGAAVTLKHHCRTISLT